MAYLTASADTVAMIAVVAAHVAHGGTCISGGVLTIFQLAVPDDTPSRPPVSRYLMTSLVDRRTGAPRLRWRTPPRTRPTSCASTSSAPRSPGSCSSTAWPSRCGGCARASRSRAPTSSTASRTAPTSARASSPRRGQRPRQHDHRLLAGAPGELGGRRDRRHRGLPARRRSGRELTAQRVSA